MYGGAREQSHIRLHFESGRDRPWTSFIVDGETECFRVMNFMIHRHLENGIFQPSKMKLILLQTFFAFVFNITGVFLWS